MIRARFALQTLIAIAAVAATAASVASGAAHQLMIHCR